MTKEPPSQSGHAEATTPVVAPGEGGIAAADVDLFQLAVEASPAAIFMVNAQGVIELANAESERLFGYRREDLIGMPIEDLIPSRYRVAHRGFRDGFAGAPLKRQMGVGRDLRALRRDGVEIPVEIGLNPAPHASGFKVLAVVVDIAARIEAERTIRDKVAELERANAGLEHFAFGASHDIQEPLRKIVSFSEVLEIAVRDDNRVDIAMALRVIRSSSLHARALVADVLSLARSMNGIYEPEPIVFADIVDEALDNLSQMAMELAAQIDVQVEPLKVIGDRHQAVRLVQNFLQNALKYHKPNSTPRVRISSRTEADGDRVLSIRDEGVGFAGQYSEAIFEPFKRLNPRDVYGGSGLGLAISKAVADRHGWRLRAFSEPGQGACFEIVFPVGVIVDD